MASCRILGALTRFNGNNRYFLTRPGDYHLFVHINYLGTTVVLYLMRQLLFNGYFLAACTGKLTFVPVKHRQLLDFMFNIEIKIHQK